jgi:iron complex outermembrane recepter protein
MSGYRSMLAVAAALTLWSPAAPAQSPSAAANPETPQSVTLPAVEVIATSPLPGAGIDRDKVPGSVQTLTGNDFTRNASPIASDTLFQRVPGMSLSDPNGNGAAQELDYRGFAASSLQGSAQGLAVYMNGIRLNEAFGDTVNWDLIPTNALERGDVWSNNPIFGLNALGGAINLQMKNGFTYQGFQSELQGGSFGRFTGSAEYGVQLGDYSAYVAAQGLHDGGWRFRSPTDLGRGFADFGWRSDRAELHLIGAVAASAFGVAAATPLDLLSLDNRAVYTTPQTTQNRMGLLGLSGKYALTETFSLQSNLYIRGFRQHHIDGNPGDTERCSNGSSTQFLNHLCLQDDAFPRPNPITAAFHDQFAILDQNNSPIPCPAEAGNPCGTAPYGTLDRTATRATTMGASLQATSTEPLFGHGNHFVIGGGIDRGRVNFTAASTLGLLNPDLTITINPAISGNGAIIHTLGGFGFVPVNIDTRNTYYGFYALDVFDITERLAATAGARLNIATLAIGDRLGTSPDLNSSQTYIRLNPVTGLTYKLTQSLTAYGGYSESNRAPRPVELACANPVKPCLIESSLVSDPPLRQVVARTYELGLRDRLSFTDGKLEWQAGLFRTDTTDDIINVASIIQGRGFFQNVPGTRRQGIEAGLRYQSSRWAAYAGYNFLDATYRFTGDLPSRNNPLADQNGNVHVTPGKHIPGLPQHQAKFGVDFMPTPQWKLGADLLLVGSRYFVGDDANQNSKLPGYWLVNLHASYQITKELQVFGLINNLFDRRYALFGTYFDPSAVAAAGLPVTLRDRRTEVLGQPLAIYGGIRITF